MLLPLTLFDYGTQQALRFRARYAAQLRGANKALAGKNAACQQAKNDQYDG